MLSRRAITQLASPLRRAVSTSRPTAKDSSTAVEKLDSSSPKQAPNYPATWTTSQRLRPGLSSSPRFEQTNMDLQPNPLSAMELISQEPVRVVNGRRAVCDGGVYLAGFTPCGLG
jgi:NADH dehydrogenase (ubiquinone) Fe-S protein 6